MKSQEDFITWLQSKDPNSFVGNANRENSCPLKNFFSESNPDVLKINFDWSFDHIESEAVLEYTLITSDASGVRTKQPLPDWAQTVARNIDTMGYGTPVRAKDLLRVLL